MLGGQGEPVVGAALVAGDADGGGVVALAAGAQDVVLVPHGPDVQLAVDFVRILVVVAALAVKIVQHFGLQILVHQGVHIDQVGVILFCFGVDAVLAGQGVLDALEQLGKIVDLALGNVFGLLQGEGEAQLRHKSAGFGGVTGFHVGLDQVAAGDVLGQLGNVIVFLGAVFQFVVAQGPQLVKIQLGIELFDGFFQVVDVQPVLVHLHLFGEQVGALVIVIQVQIHRLGRRHKGVGAGITGQVQGDGVADLGAVQGVGQQDVGLVLLGVQQVGGFGQLDLVGLLVVLEGGIAPGADGVQLAVIHGFPFGVHHVQGAGFLVGFVLVDLGAAAALGADKQRGQAAGFQGGQLYGGAAFGPQGHRSAGGQGQLIPVFVLPSVQRHIFGAGHENTQVGAVPLAGNDEIILIIAVGGEEGDQVHLLLFQGIRGGGFRVSDIYFVIQLHGLGCRFSGSQAHAAQQHGQKQDHPHRFQ